MIPESLDHPQSEIKFIAPIIVADTYYGYDYNLRIIPGPS